MTKKRNVVLLFLLSFLLVSCGQKKEGPKTFAQEHDAFETKLVRNESDDDEIPAPPEGVFDLVTYPSKVGDLSAYVSSDPGDGQKHPLIIWVVGGWGNGIDGFPWSYPYWDNDQTASAFWREGVLTMYPSFRGGSGNPGYYETLFGEVDDIVSAYEYAAALPYVDPDRIYLGGHSTGGTKALLAAEYTDKFRAAFCFGAVDEIKYHNNDQFTFDTSNQEEYVMRSPVYWLENVKTPTFLIEGIDGNSRSLKNIQEKSDNENISCYIIDDADHFSVLAPVTELLARKILSDTGEISNITITQEELEKAVKQEPKTPMPLMTRYENEELGLSFSYPFMWEVEETMDGDRMEIYLYSSNYEDNVWDATSIIVDVYPYDNPDYLEEFRPFLEPMGYQLKDKNISGYACLEADGITGSQGGSSFVNKAVLMPKDGTFIELDLVIPESYGNQADALFKEIADSIALN